MKVCPFCKRQFPKLTVHHILPKRFFTSKPFTVNLCRDCHNEIEYQIPAFERLPIGRYFTIVNSFYEKKRRKNG